ncbi:MFS transporter [Pasteurella bettyae]|uniref:MFS transporter, aromatic acid:H+ symporter (AAHS) family n=1 Tax=Pasteurella bettyae CCUG 2042 TaxID=1095749 RepID=I3DIX2_9PAST|nr:MFS transporter [Pasteurella bettyae]EIJ71665.1 MFS transporter, aromatic acid:H+ symporter (AAHS) family [Pasteurella bettyae CCUG 2042]SUB22312.1 putative metabolite transport protein [Pasteurella bettyae]
MNLRETIDSSIMSAYQWMIIIIASVMNLLDGFDVLALAFTATAIRNDLALTGTELGSLLSAGLLGMAAGSLFLAPVADKIGRRPLLLISVSLSALGMLGSAYSASFNSLAIWRVITGLGVGGILVGTNVLTSEYSSRKWRSLAISIYASGFGVGAVLGGMFAVMLQQEYSWHAVFIAGFVLTTICLFVLVFWLPESIDFLITKQPRNAQCKLNKITRKMGLKGEWLLPEKVTSTVSKLPINQLFNQNYRKSTALIWIAFFSIMFGYYFVSSWTPALLKDAGMTTEQSVSVGMMISLGGTCGSLLYGLLASRWSAKSILLAFTILSAITVVVFILSASMLWLAMIFAILVGGFMNGCISGLYTLNPSIYASDIRSTGVGWSIGIGRIGAILAPIVAGLLLDDGWNKQSLYIGVGFVLFISTLALSFLKIRTTLGSIKE